MEELLDVIASYTHCDYLSDLHLSKYFEEIAEALEKLESKSYSLDEWNSTIQYITQQKVDFDDQEKAKKFLHDYLTQPK